MLRFDLGPQSFPISTKSPLAQKLFDQGLNWCFGFNQEEGVACFQEAIKHDPNCAMAHWGVAYAAGPFYNMPWRDFSDAEATECTAYCHGHIEQAKSLSAHSSDLEKALVAALGQRIPKPHPVDPKTYDTWDQAYADAMRVVNEQFPDDPNVMSLFIEAMMTRTPWKLWDVKTNRPPEGADTLEALDLCEYAIKLADESDAPQHPAILHLHIHVLEMSPTPERALDSANRLGGLCPDAGHIHHMPAHIYALVGDYSAAKSASEKAIVVNRKYLAYAGPYNYYTTARCHDLHMMMYACMFLGQYEPAIAAAHEMCATLTPDVIDQKSKPFIAATMEGYHSMGMHVLVRFGKWQEIIDTPLPENQTLYCVTTAMHHYAQGVAHAALGNLKNAHQCVTEFHAAVSRIPARRKFFNNLATAILGVAEKMMEGEIAYHAGNYDKAFDALRESVRRNDDLEYTEPWAWMHPPRHALGALLIEQGHYDEAEAVFRADLGFDGKLQRCAQHLDNIWSLHGLVECLRKRGDTKELPLMQSKLKKAQLLADVNVSSSCCCRTKIDQEMQTQ